MNKKLIALAVGAALGTPMAAQAGATVYGHGQVEIANYGSDAKGTAVVDNARGRIGVKSTEDLGGGLKALFKVEFKADFADGVASNKSDASLTKREMMVGLKGNFGEVQLGRLKTAYKYTGGVVYDPFVASVLEARDDNAMSGKVGAGALNNSAGHHAFVDDSIAYKNKFGDISLWITYDLDDGGPTSDTGGNALTASLKFSQKNWEVFVATVDDDNDGAPGNGYSATKFGGQFRTGPHKISAQIENADTGAAVNPDIQYIYLDYQFKMGKNIFDAAYGQVDPDGDNNDHDWMRLAVIHKFSKKTRAWIGWANKDADQAGSDSSVVSVGLRVDI